MYRRFCIEPKLLIASTWVKYFQIIKTISFGRSVKWVGVFILSDILKLRTRLIRVYRTYQFLICHCLQRWSKKGCFVHCLIHTAGSANLPESNRFELERNISFRRNSRYFTIWYRGQHVCNDMSIRGRKVVFFLSIEVSKESHVSFKYIWFTHTMRNKKSISL